MKYQVKKILKVSAIKYVVYWVSEPPTTIISNNPMQDIKSLIENGPDSAIKLPFGRCL